MTVEPIIHAAEHLHVHLPWKLATYWLQLSSSSGGDSCIMFNTSYIIDKTDKNYDI
jgi:hypothetical protein